MRLSRFLFLSLAFSIAACGDLTQPAVDRSAPTDLTYQLIPSGDPATPLGVLLSWTPPQNGSAVSYDVFGRSSQSGDWLRRGTTTSPSFHDAGVPQLEYYVLAVDGNGNELGETDPVLIDERNRLETPAGLVSISLDNAIQLIWSSNAVDADPDIFDYYRIYSAEYNTSAAQCSNQWALEGSTVSDGFLSSNLPNGVRLCFAVSAVSTDGHESAWSTIRDDTPRYDARNVLVAAREVDASTGGFLFYDQSNGNFGVVAPTSRSDLDFTVSRDNVDGSLWFSPGRSGVQIALYSANQVTDLTSIDRAPTTGYSSNMIEAVPGYAYVFSTTKSDGTHYGAVRVAYVGTDYVVFDWSYQSSAGNPELSREPVRTGQLAN